MIDHVGHELVLIMKVGAHRRRIVRGRACSLAGGEPEPRAHS